MTGILQLAMIQAFTAHREMEIEKMEIFLILGSRMTKFKYFQ